jgi:nicotinate-nucleotide adenylyltransferase
LGLSPEAQRIGVFGGAFDPPHTAHVLLAQTALAELSLDVLYVIPTGHAWHKTRTLSPAEHRLAMTKLAFADFPDVLVDDREIKRPGPTFTIDTLQAMQAEHPGAQLYLVMGADQFSAFSQWHLWQEILQIAIICVAARARFDWAEGQFAPLKEHQNRVLTLQMPPMSASATRIRQLIGQPSSGGLGENDALAGLLPPSVASYIAQHQLYKSP